MGIWQRLTADFIADREPDSSSQAGDEKLAAAVILLEMAHADDEFTSAERKILTDILQDEFKLTGEEAESLGKQAMEKREVSLDLYQFTETLNTAMTPARRLRIVERLWEIVFADGHLDGHEDHLIHRLTELLNLHHQDLINAKIKIKNNLSG